MNQIYGTNDSIYSMSDSVIYKEQTGHSIVFASDTGNFYRSSDAVKPNNLIFTELNYKAARYSAVDQSAGDLTQSIILIVIFVGFIVTAVLRSWLNIKLIIPILRLGELKNTGDEEEKSRKTLADAAYFILFIIGAVLLLTKVFENTDYSIGTNGYLFDAILTGAGIMAGFFILKLFNRILYSIFSDESYLGYNRVLHQLVVAVAFPLFIFAAAAHLSGPITGNIFYMIALSVPVVAYMIKTVKYARINYIHNLRVYYLFLYLCSLEALPLLLVFRESVSQ